MFAHIIVPLDGSRLAETALPIAVYLSTILGSQVALVHIVEENASPVIHGDRHLITPREAESYLENIRREFFAADARVSCHVHTHAAQNVADAILLHQSELNPDLIVMCTHGRGGVREFIFGSIAQQVVEAGQTPVLIIRPDTVSRQKAKPIHTLFAATDNDPQHWQGLQPAFQLAKKIKARLHILGVVPTMGALSGKHATLGRFMPATTYHVLEMAESELRSFFTEKTRNLNDADVGPTLQVARGDPLSLIIKTADSVDADVIILGTHGKAGTAAFWSGSIAARVVKQTLRPLLLIPV
jgi:nucleotide-binding universal stress UspA family protein